MLAVFRFFRAVSPALGGLALLGLAACRPAPPATAPNPPGRTSVALQTDWYPVAEHGGYYQALARGFYAAAGLDVKILPGGPGSYGPPAVAAGQVAFAMGRSDEVILAVQQGLPLVIVTALMQHDPQALMLHADDPARSFADLDGRNIMASPGNTWIEYLQRKHRIRLNLAPLDFGLARFVATPRAVQQCFVSSEPYFLALQNVPVRTLLIADSGYDPYRVIYSNTAFVRDHPDAVRAFVTASARGWHDFLRGDPTPARKIILQNNTQMPAGLVDYSIATLRDRRLVEGDPARGERIGLLDPARLRAQTDLLHNLGLLPADFPPERFVRFDFPPPPFPVSAPVP